MVTVRSCIASSSAAWVLGGVRLISSASSSSQKIGPLIRVKVAGLEVEQVGAEDVARHQVGRELDAAELQVERAGEALGQEGLGRARRAFQQDVAAGEQRGQHQVDGLGLADHGLGDLGADAVGEGLHLTDVHASSPVSIGRGGGRGA